jgi:hypothetical protein
LKKMTAMVLAGVLAMAGCESVSGPAEDDCVRKAAQDASAIEKEVSPLLPELIAKTMSEHNSCDSGADGSYVIFEADRSTSGYKLLADFRRNGWEVMDAPSDECPACVAGVSRSTKGRTMEVTVLDRRDELGMEVVARYL